MAKTWNGPDGKTYDFPDDATDEEIQDYFLLTLPAKTMTQDKQIDWLGAVGNAYGKRNVTLPPEHDSKQLTFPADALDYEIHNYIKEQYGVGDRTYKDQRVFEDSRAMLGGLSRVAKLEQNESILAGADPSIANLMNAEKDDALRTWKESSIQEPDRFKQTLSTVTGKEYETASAAFNDLKGQKPR